MASFPQSDPIAELLKRAKTIAVVGLSSNPFRPSHGVSAYMQTHGYRIIPVNPNIEECLGEKAYASLLDVPEKNRHRQHFSPVRICGGDCRPGNSAQSSGHLDAGRCHPRESRREGAQSRDFRGDGPLHPERASRTNALDYRPTPTNTTLASSRRLEPFTKDRTSSKMLTAEASGLMACSASRPRPYSSCFEFSASVMPSL